ncbi:PREDICTED: A-kinase anchor protein 10, mitochondrial-like [Priapulus caudatus]|uniref:A-kinase anchor protein 10, mitochondrial-like n=1 Tax=Priapulus caudatus TaxID=37621 RepID=A0ABM1EEZ1_PRICU|nr:PREDICTED: A-kinase anchor protein 10, mitochondrial-like [Priapulus caudatus]
MSFFKRRLDKSKNKVTASPVRKPPVLVAPSGYQQTGHSSSALQSSVQSGPDICNGDIGVPESILGPAQAREKSSRQQHSLLIDDHLGDLGQRALLSTLKRSSRLSKAYHEVLRDRNALGHYVRFMEARAAGRLVRFWLDADSFQTTTWLRIRTHALNCMTRTTLGQCSTIGRSVDGHGATDPALAHDAALTDNGLAAAARGQNLCSESGAPHEGAGGCAGETSDAKTLPNRTDAALHLNVKGDAIAEKLRKGIEADAMLVYSKFIAQDASDPIGVGDRIRNEIIRKICREDGLVDPSSFVAAQDFVSDIMIREYFPVFQQSFYHCKHQIDVLTSGTVYLEDLLYNETAFFYFMEFMEQENAMLLIEFWMATDNFCRHLQEQDGNYDSMQAQADAMVLYEKYFSLQATSPLGFSQAVRFEVESNICREDGPLPDCFDQPLKIVLHTMDQMYLKPFLQSEIYFRYLTEIINTIQLSDTDPAPGNRLRPRTGSSASSEQSTQSEGAGVAAPRNTLLAMESSAHDQQAVRRIMRSIEDEFHIDPAQLTPQKLWSRPQAGNLTLGHMDELGRYCTDFEPEPRRKDKAFKISMAVKKFITKDEDKEKEDMAVKIAQMIVNDITTITMGAPVLSSDTQSISSLDSHEGSTAAIGFQGRQTRDSSPTT